MVSCNVRGKHRENIHEMKGCQILRTFALLPMKCRLLPSHSLQQCVLSTRPSECQIDQHSVRRKDRPWPATPRRSFASSAQNGDFDETFSWEWYVIICDHVWSCVLHVIPSKNQSTSHCKKQWTQWTIRAQSRNTSCLQNWREILKPTYSQ